jgi:F0F1-type ATP synthase assembly protein I
MPLSEDEQRILQEIEAQFYANDPQLAQQVSETTLYRHASRNIKWAALGFVVGFIVLLTTFASNTPVGFIGFLGMMGCAFVIVSNVRKMGKAGLESITASMKGKRLKSLFGDAGKNLRRPFRKDDNSN